MQHDRVLGQQPQPVLVKPVGHGVLAYSDAGACCPSLCLRAGQLRQARDEQAIIETTIAKYFASKTAVQAALDAIQVLGASGCRSGNTAERLLREAKILEIIEGTSQVQQQLIGDFGLNEYGLEPQHSYITKKASHR